MRNKLGALAVGFGLGVLWYFCKTHKFGVEIIEINGIPVCPCGDDEDECDACEKSEQADCECSESPEAEEAPAEEPAAD